MRITVLFLLGAALIFPAPAARALDCENAATQAEMNACAGERYEQSDATLNQRYREAMDRLDDDEQARSSLRKAQRAWIAFRDAHCDFMTSGSRDGSIYPALQAGCLADLTDERTQELNTLLDCAEGDLTCPIP